MPEDLYALAARVATTYAKTPGYLGSTVRSTDPPILAHAFSTVIDAERFCDALVLAGSKSKFRIEGATVLEARPTVMHRA
jgi:hypothetical protein